MVDRKIISKWAIFHCYVELSEGIFTQFYIMVIKKSICISNKTRCDKQSGGIAVIPMVYEAYLY
jgi:hypothetical protein